MGSSVWRFRGLYGAHKHHERQTMFSLLLVTALSLPSNTPAPKVQTINAGTIVSSTVVCTRRELTQGSGTVRICERTGR